MNKRIKKILAVVLVVISVFSSASVGLVGASAAQSPIPVVYIEGTGSAIYKDKNDNNSENLHTYGWIPDGLVSDLVPQLITPLIEAYKNGSFDEYCDKVVELYLPYSEKMALDENGEVTDNSGNDCIQTFPTYDKKRNGGYLLTDYVFYYDWRLDPFYTAEKLSEFIEQIKAITGSSKVNIISRCYATNVVLAYSQAYGNDNINNVIFYASGFYGFEYVGALFSGRIHVDSDSLERFLNVSLDSNDETQNMIKATIQVANTSFMLDWGIKEVMDFYEKIYENLVPRIVRLCYGTFPSYWSMIPVEYYDDAVQLVFGKEPEKYAKMIEKTDHYHNDVAMHVDDILKKMVSDGVCVYKVAKYGFQEIPLSEGCKYQSDEDVSVWSSSAGATTTEVLSKFDKIYLGKAKSNGTDKYISPDNSIDASTCLLADHTWFIKNLQHSEMPSSVDNALFVTMFGSSNYMTVFDNPNYPQYLLFDRNSWSLKVLTADNCNTDREKQMGGDVEESSKLVFGFLGDFISSILNTILDMVRILVDAFKPYIN